MCDIFLEKGQDPDGWINAGYYIVDPMVLDMIPGDGCVWEKDVLQALALQGRLAAFQHPGEFQMMDTWRDRKYLDKLAQSDDPFWLRWEK
jgi:glucose-1-phosphate cytidylyltransferase